MYNKGRLVRSTRGIFSLDVVRTVTMGPETASFREIPTPAAYPWPWHVRSTIAVADRYSVVPASLGTCTPYECLTLTYKAIDRLLLLDHHDPERKFSSIAQSSEATCKSCSTGSERLWLHDSFAGALVRSVLFCLGRSVIAERPSLIAKALSV